MFNVILLVNYVPLFVKGDLTLATTFHINFNSISLGDDVCRTASRDPIGKLRSLIYLV